MLVTHYMHLPKIWIKLQESAGLFLVIQNFTWYLNFCPHKFLVIDPSFVYFKADLWWVISELHIGNSLQKIFLCILCKESKENFFYFKILMFVTFWLKNRNFKALSTEIKLNIKPNFTAFTILIEDYKILKLFSNSLWVKFSLAFLRSLCKELKDLQSIFRTRSIK